MHLSSLLQVAQCKCSSILLKTLCPALSTGYVLLSTGQILGPESFRCDRQFLFWTPAAGAHCSHCFSAWLCSGQCHHVIFSLHLSLWLVFFFFYPAGISFLVEQMSVLFFWFGWYEFNMCLCFIQSCIRKSVCWDVVVLEMVERVLGQRRDRWSWLWSLIY